MIDRNPQVGRILMRESHIYHMFVRKSGVISKVSGSRIYYIEEDKFYGDQEKYVSTYACVCDTPEEEEMLIAHSKKCLEEFKVWEKEKKVEFKSFFNKE